MKCEKTCFYLSMKEYNIFYNSWRLKIHKLVAVDNSFYIYNGNGLQLCIRYILLYKAPFENKSRKVQLFLEINHFAFNDWIYTLVYVENYMQFVVSPQIYFKKLTFIRTVALGIQRPIITAKYKIEKQYPII